MNGTRQSGEAVDLRIASLSTDGQILEQARALAASILEEDPKLSKSENSLLAALKERYRTGDAIDYGMIS